jgi:hypothetical protein
VGGSLKLFRFTQLRGNTEDFVGNTLELEQGCVNCFGWKITSKTGNYAY